jgi:hypothetical protein
MTIPEAAASGRRVLLYFAWSRHGETDANILEIDDRFPAIFELRRLFYPTFEHLSDPEKVDQGIGGFLDHVQKPNFTAFIEQAEKQTGHDVVEIERIVDDGTSMLFDDALIHDFDTIIIISYDSLRTAQTASAAEIEAVRRFLTDPDHLVFVCPHHDIGEAEMLTGEPLLERRTAEYHHHGDHATPPQQGFGGFARTLLAGLGVPVKNRFGLRPAATPNGLPAPVDVDRSLDEIGVLVGIESLNLHPHLPHLERIGEARNQLDVLARHSIDETAPPHPAMTGQKNFDSLLQSHADVFGGKLFVCDTTMFSSTQGGVESLRRLWSNVLDRPRRK